MSKQDWLRNFPKESYVYPSMGNEPNDYYKPCPRIGENVLVDVNGNCMKNPKFEVCSGCICLGFKDVAETNKRENKMEVEK